MINISPPQEFRMGVGSSFDGDSPNPSAWTLLDLSNKIGATYTVVILYIKTVGGGAAPAGYAVRAAGSFEALPENFPSDAGGCHSCHIPGANGAGYVICDTNSQGQIDWYCTVVDNPTIIAVEWFAR